jgi:hypothetical protein
MLAPPLRRRALGAWLPALVLLAVLQLPSLRAIARYGHGLALPGGLLLFAGALAFYMWASRPQRTAWQSRLLGWPLAAALLGLMAAAAHWLYPIADGLKVHMRGSDMDDAVQVAVHGLLAGHSPYAGATYMGTALSPGPGLVLLYVPFVPWGGYAFGAVAAMAGCALLLRHQTASWRAPALMLAFAASSIFFLELLVVGSDLIMVSCGLVAMAAGLRMARGPGGLAALAVLCALLATSRVVFLYLPFVFALVLWQRSKRQALAFASGAVALSLGLHAWLYLKGPAIYSPLHLIGKGQSLMTGPFRAMTLLACLAAAGYVIGRARKGLLSPYEAPLLCLGVPLAGIACAELAYRGGNLLTWEGANYLMPIVPLACAWAAERAANVPTVAHAGSQEVQRDA